ncbi:MAG: DNA-3-methyladenine glycosylase family protein [Propylenella sp.]
MKPIETEGDITRATKALLAVDPRLGPIAEIAGPLPLRRRDGGFEGLASIVTSQQISDMAGAAIWGRLRAAVDPFTAETFLATPEEAFKSAGLSRPKIRTLTGIAAAMANGFNLDAIHHLPAEEALAEMVQLKGIGPWTAEIYLLFCVGHPDIFPAGDLALQAAVHQGLMMRKRPEEKKLRKVAEKWSPWRGVAARLFWAYYRARRAAAKELAFAAKQRGRAGA